MIYFDFKVHSDAKDDAGELQRMFALAAHHFHATGSFPPSAGNTPIVHCAHLSVPITHLQKFFTNASVLKGP
jgi:hypothetical protein